MIGIQEKACFKQNKIRTIAHEFTYYLESILPCHSTFQPSNLQNIIKWRNENSTAREYDVHPENLEIKKPLQTSTSVLVLITTSKIPNKHLPKAITLLNTQLFSTLYLIPFIFSFLISSLGFCSRKKVSVGISEQ